MNDDDACVVAVLGRKDVGSSPFWPVGLSTVAIGPICFASGARKTAGFGLCCLIGSLSKSSSPWPNVAIFAKKLATLSPADFLLVSSVVGVGVCSPPISNQ